MNHTQINNLVFNEFKLQYVLGVFLPSDIIDIITGTYNTKILRFLSKHEKSSIIRGVIDAELALLQHLINEKI